MELAGYLAIVRRWWAVLVAAVIVAAAAGYVIASQVPKTYEAQVRLLVGPISADLDVQRASGQLAHTYAELVTSQGVAESVIRRLNLTTLRTDQLEQATTAIPNDITRIVAIRVQNRDPNIAARLANAMADAIGEFGLSAGTPEGQTRIVDPAQPPTTPVAPQVPLLVLLAAFAGLLVAISLIVLIEYLRDSVRSEEELAQLMGAPILGRLPQLSGRRGDFATTPDSADRYRAMTARLEQVSGGGLSSLLVVGASPNGGAGLAATGIALGFADRGIRAALVDANLRHPDATYALGLTPVADHDRWMTRDQVAGKRVVFVSSMSREGDRPSIELTVVPPGEGLELENPAIAKSMLAKWFSHSAKVVVITSSPFDRSPEALIWGALVDGIVLVVEEGSTRRADIRSTVKAMELANVRLVGAVIITPPPALRLRWPGARPDWVVTLAARYRRTPRLWSITPDAPMPFGASHERDR